MCILTHDPKFDVPAVIGALATGVGYIGVMGSRTTHSKRLARLAEAGVSDPAQLDRLMSPTGLDIGARTPEETAISICAEIIATHTNKRPQPPRQRRPDPLTLHPSAQRPSAAGPPGSAPALRCAPHSGYSVGSP